MDDNVQQGAVQEGTVSTEQVSQATAVATEEQATQVAPLTAEAVQKLLAEEREATRRAIQSEKDRALAEIGRANQRVAVLAEKARVAEETMQRVKQRSQDLDPEVAKEMRLAELEAKEALGQEQQQVQGQQQQAMAVERQFYQDMGESLQALSVDVTDKRIDWAAGVPDYKQRLMKIMASANTILTQNAQEKERKMTQSFKDEIAQLRKDLGMDKTDTSQPQGSNTGGIPNKMADFRRWLDEMPTEEYAKRKKEIDAAVKSGRIKE